MGEEEKEETLTDDRMTSGMRSEIESRSSLALFTCVWFGRWGGGAVCVCVCVCGWVGGWVGGVGGVAGWGGGGTR